MDRPLQMVTSFRALNSMLNIRRGSGLVLDWQQNQGLIFAGGDSRSIRVWDTHRERSPGVGGKLCCSKGLSLRLFSTYRTTTPSWTVQSHLWPQTPTLLRSSSQVSGTAAYKFSTGASSRMTPWYGHIWSIAPGFEEFVGKRERRRTSYQQGKC